MDLLAEIDEVATQQFGVMTRRQLLAAGVPPGAIRWRLSRRWRLLLPGVILLDSSLPTHEQRLVAALLLAGPSSWLAGPTAAAMHGLGDPGSSRRVHVLVPAPATPRDVAWVSIRRTHLSHERLFERGPLRWSSAARAVVDAAALASTDDEARAIIIRAVQERRVRLDDVHHWVEARRPNGRRRLRIAVREAASGAWSVPEADLLRLLRGSSVLPTVWANPALIDDSGRRLTTPDAWVDDIAMAVMVHSRRFHGDVLDWEATVDRDSDLAAARVVVIGVTPHAIQARPAETLRRIEDAYLAAKAAGSRPDVTARPRTASQQWPA